jgi:hypothetical protein
MKSSKISRNVIFALLAVLILVAGVAAVVIDPDPFIRVTTMGYCEQTDEHYLRVRNDGDVAVENAAARRAQGNVVTEVGPLAPGELVYIPVPVGSYDGGYMDGDTFVRTHGRSTVPNNSEFCPPPPPAPPVAAPATPYCVAYAAHMATSDSVVIHVRKAAVNADGHLDLVMYDWDGSEYVPAPGSPAPNVAGVYEVPWSVFASFDGFGCAGPYGTAQPVINAAKAELGYWYNNPTLAEGRDRFCQVWDTTSALWPEIQEDAALSQMAGVCQ